MGNFQFIEPLPLWPGLRPTVPIIISQSNVESHTGDAETIDITGGKITVPQGFFGPGATFRFVFHGRRAGTAGAVTMLIDINGTTVATLAVPTNTAVDFGGEFIISEHTDMAHQNTSAHIYTSATVLSAYDYAAATVNVSKESIIKLQATVANASDDVYIEYVRAEYWKI